MPFIDGRDRASQILCLVGSIDHVFYCLFVVPIFFCHLIQSQMKLTGCHMMHIIVLKKTLCHNVYSLSNAHDWTFHNEMAGVSTLLAETFLGGRE